MILAISAMIQNRIMNLPGTLAVVIHENGTMVLTLFAPNLSKDSIDQSLSKNEGRKKECAAADNVLAFQIRQQTR